MDPASNGVGENSPEVVSEKVVINGQEYDVNQAQELIGLGQKTREYETQWNTKLDKVWPEYGKTTQTLKTREAELTEARSKLAQYEQKKDAGVETSMDVRQAQEAARKLGITLKDDLEKEGYIRKTELESILEQHISKREQEKEAVNQVLSQADKLEKEIDGSDGRPKFIKKVVLAYANAYSIPDLDAAYKDMNSEALKTWQDAQLASKKSPSLKTLKGGNATKQPAPVAMNDGNVNEALKEALWGSKE